jgi:hypothetical protein
MYLASGKFDHIPAIVRTVNIFAKSSKDRIPVDMVDLTRIRMQGELKEHINKSIALLRRLGVPIRRRGYFWFQAEDKKRKIKVALKSLTDEEILRISIEANDTKDITEMFVAQGLIHSLLQTQAEEDEPTHSNLTVVVACKMVENFLKGQSNHDFSVICLTLAACLFCNTQPDEISGFRRLIAKLLGLTEQSDLALSIRLAELALQLPGTDNNIQMIGVVGFIRHWRRPLTNCTEALLKGYNLGMKR